MPTEQDLEPGAEHAAHGDRSRSQACRLLIIYLRRDIDQGHGVAAGSPGPAHTLG